jgi:DNA polymerase III delta prime subunit
MMQVNDREFLWVEKYRPKTIDECVLPESIKATFRDYIKQGELPTFLLVGSPGVGKTTVARALCEEVGAEYLFINGSDEGRSIDMLRTTVRNFASTISLTDAKKMIIIDEADFMNASSVQPAMRSFIEEFSSNCRFIFTCNYVNRIIEPLRSRCSIVDFKIESKDKPQVAGEFYKRVVQILKNENVEFESKVVAELITKHFPDYRRVLNELQRYSVSGKIDSGILVNLTEQSFKELIKLLKDKNFTEVRKWVGRHVDSDSVSLYRNLYDSASAIMEPSSIPELVLIIAGYQYKAAFVADHEVNTMACLTEIMRDCRFL